MAEKLGQSPANLLRIREPITAYCFDRACWMFGTAVQSEMDQVEQRTKGKGASARSIEARKRMVLNKWIPPKAGSTKGRFRDPAIRG